MHYRKVFISITLVIILLLLWWNRHIYSEKFGSIPKLFFENETGTTRTRLATSPSTLSARGSTVTPTTTYPWQERFHVTMSAAQRLGMLALLNIFKGQMEKYNITYLLYGGSLLGAHRHHGMIPWDDDIDVLVDGNKKGIMRVALGELNATHALHYYGDGVQDSWKWKFYKLDGQPYTHQPFRYPYLDLFFLKPLNSTMFYVEIHKTWIPANIIFPLIAKEFDGISVPTPCNTDLFLKYDYATLEECGSPSWNHSAEYGIPGQNIAVVPCSILKPFFGFVERRSEKMKDKIFVSETLRKGEEVIQVVSYFLPLSCGGTYSSFNSSLQVRKVNTQKI